eukprot:569755-Rhodomonas_salina.1
MDRAIKQFPMHGGEEPNWQEFDGAGSASLDANTQLELQNLLDSLPPPDDQDACSETAASKRQPAADKMNERDPVSWHFSAAADARSAHRPAEVSSSDDPQNEIVKLSALIRAKDRLLAEKDAAMSALRQELGVIIPSLTQQRDSLAQDVHQWASRYEELNQENVELRAQVEHAQHTISALEGSAQALQEELTQATGSISELQLQVAGLESGE